MQENNKLLKCLINDSLKYSNLYQPGSYWKKKNLQSFLEIEKKGIKNFRGSDNNIGESFSDNQNTDILNDYYGCTRGLFRLILKKLYPLKNIFIRQLKLTSNYMNEKNLYKSMFFEQNTYIKKLSNIFHFNDTVNCGCEDFSILNNKKISNHYLTIADTHLNFSKKIDFKKIKSFFEIGGGFGANIHFLIQNYSNLNKIVYLDLPVNLYIATQYLKKFYKDSVRDYLNVRSDKIEFSKNDNLEIICIPPWKIKDLNIKIDLFQNSNSFVEMPKNVILNYSSYIEKTLHLNSKVALSSYGKFNPNTTLDPATLKDFFDLEFDIEFAPSMVPKQKNIYLISRRFKN